MFYRGVVMLIRWLSSSAKVSQLNAGVTLRCVSRDVGPHAVPVFFLLWTEPTTIAPLRTEPAARIDLRPSIFWKGRSL